MRTNGRQPSRSSERSDSWSPSGRHHSPARSGPDTNGLSLPEASTSRRHDQNHLYSRVSHSPPQSGGQRASMRLSKRKNLQEDEDHDDITAPSSSKVHPAAPSSQISHNSQHLSQHTNKPDLKGKRRAYSDTAPEDTSDIAGEAVGHHGLDRSAPPTDQNSPKQHVNTSRNSLAQTHRPCVRTLQPTRNRTLLESVRAHLNRKPSSTTLPNLENSAKNLLCDDQGVYLFRLTINL